MFPATVSLTVPNAAALAVLTAFIAGTAEAAPATTPSPAKEPAPAPKSAAAPAAAPGPATAQVQEVAAPAKTASAPSPAAESAAAAAPASTAATDPVNYEQVKQVVIAITKTKGRDVAVAALAQFGVAKAQDLKPEQYADFVAQAKALLAESTLA